jgi:hypothetical protein
MPPADIKEFRGQVRAELIRAGFKPRKFDRRAPPVWTLPQPEVVPTFFPHELRRPYGFHLTGSIGIELPELRAWLKAERATEAIGIFAAGFVSCHIANDLLLHNFRVAFGEEPPLADWISTIKERLSGFPRTLDELVEVYRTAPDRLLGLGHSVNKPASDFLVDWYPERRTAVPIPQTFF